MSFALEISNFVKKAKGNNDTLVRKTVLDIGTRLVERTPVGNPDLWEKWNKGGVGKNSDHWLVTTGFVSEGYVGGHARANWSHSEGFPDEKEFKVIDENEGENNISVRRISASCKKLGAAGKIHYIQNSVPYIERLEDGYSKQAPAGMVSVTRAEFAKIVNSVAKYINTESNINGGRYK